MQLSEVCALRLSGVLLSVPRFPIFFFCENGPDSADRNQEISGRGSPHPASNSCSRLKNSFNAFFDGSFADFLNPVLFSRFVQYNSQIKFLDVFSRSRIFDRFFEKFCPAGKIFRKLTLKLLSCTKTEFSDPVLQNFQTLLC